MTANNDMPRIADSIYRAGYDDRVKLTPEQLQRMKKGKSPYLRDRKDTEPFKDKEPFHVLLLYGIENF